MNKSTWIQLIKNHKKICGDVLECSKDIRYAGCFNEYGRTIAGKMRPGIKPLFSPNVVREEFFAIASTMRLRHKTSKSLGELQYILVNHNKINILLFSKNNMTFYVTFNPKTFPNLALISKIKKIITK
tara:strand:+ start:633 stop:1016 length:384 start_codon:yes stop_codon:yes gene_type:complete